MKRGFLATGLALLLALFAFVAIPAQAASCPATSPCVTLQGQDIVVVILGREVARVPAPVRTVTVQVPLPVPGPTHTVIKTVPGPTRTVIVKMPGTTRTVTKVIPGATRTVTVVEGPTGQVTPTPGRLSTAPRLTPVPPKTVVVYTDRPMPGKTIVVTKGKAIGFSIFLLAVGIGLGLLLFYLLGRTIANKKARQAETDNLRELKQHFKD